MKSTFSTPVLRILFGFYVLGLAYLLFVEGRTMDLSWMVKGGFPSLFESMQNRLNLIPFRTILSYLAQMNMATGMRTIVENIAGHIVAFSWLGYFMPRLWPKYQKRRLFLIHVLMGLILVEILQYFTMSGALDIDDIALNILGAYLGLVFLRRPEGSVEEQHG